MSQYCPIESAGARLVISRGSCANILKIESLLHRLRGVVIGLVLWQAAVCSFGQPVSYDIIYVRQPRYGSVTNTIWPEVFHPARLDPGADLMLLHPTGRKRCSSAEVWGP